MSSYEMALPDGYRLTSVRLDDADQFVQLLGDGEVAGFIPAMPHPYTHQTAEWWVRHRIAFREQTGREISFAIRSPEGALLGSVGVDDLVPGRAHNGELGYWLGLNHRGRGLGSAAVKAFVSYAFDNLALERLTAQTLPFNLASLKILERAGFELEGRLREHTKTPSGVHDTLVFGLLKRDWKARFAALPAVADAASIGLRR